jgi:hypothetical protein
VLLQRGDGGEALAVGDGQRALRGVQVGVEREQPVCALACVNSWTP